MKARSFAFFLEPGCCVSNKSASLNVHMQPIRQVSQSPLLLGHNFGLSEVSIITTAHACPTYYNTISLTLRCFVFFIIQIL